MVMAMMLALVSAGCSDSVEDSRQQMHKLQVAMIEYGHKNKGEWPDRLDQIKGEVGGEEAFNKLMKNPLTGDNPGYEYVKPKGNMNDPGFGFQQVILYQLRGGKRDMEAKVGFADGSVRVLERSSRAGSALPLRSGNCLVSVNRMFSNPNCFVAHLRSYGTTTAR
jgi:hypothetical protein